MPKFAANLTLMYNEYAFLDRFAAAAADGFRGVEYLFPYEYAAADIQSRLAANGLTQVLFNAPPGNWEGGDRGLAALPEREEEFRRSIDSALDYARVLGNRRLHVMAGVITREHDRARCRASYVKNLAYAAKQALSLDITLLIEPINTRDMPGYFLNRQDEAHAIREEVAAPNLKVQFDVYHCQIVEGDLVNNMRFYLDDIGHMQIASVPGRNEPDTGEINYPYLFALTDELGYEGWVGCEYRPRAGTSEGLTWLKPWRT